MEQELEHRLCRAEERAKSNSHRLDDVERRQGQLEELVTSVSLIAQRQDTMEKDVSEMKEDVKTLIDKPGRRWESVVEKAIAAAVGAVIAYLAVSLGMG